MAQEITPKDFLGILQAQFPIHDTRDIDISTVKYALYARKSTKGEERQERSIPDQIADCMKREIIPNELNIVGKPIRETESAKEPDIRPKFRLMLDDIKAGKITGIVAWHPDRLSRNMKEAGEIIDLLDKGILRDLRFATSSFENSPTGKMLLGISFVLSKQYSEHLSESVTRGNRRKTEDGIYFAKQKHGYYIAEHGELYPDGNSFILIKQAFEKRLDGWSQVEIAKWLNTNGYMLRKKGKKPQSYKWDKDAISLLLRDTTYTGVLRYGKTFVNLTELYEFEPMLSVDDFMKINKITDLGDPKLISSLMVKPREKIKADLLRGMVYCGYCDKCFTSGITPKKLKGGIKNYYYYNCQTEGCTFKGKSVRANIVITAAIDFLSSHLFITQSNYDHYVTEAKEYAATQAKALDGDIASLSKQVGNKQSEYERTKTAVRDNPAIARHYSLDEVEAELHSLQADVKRLVATRKRLKLSILTYSEYLELFQNIGVNLAKTHDMEVLDETIQKFFSNFHIRDLGKNKEQRYDIAFTLKEPWEGFLQNDDFDHGRGDRT